MLHVRFLSLFCNFFCLLVSHHLTRSADETRRNLTDSCLWRLLHSTCSTFESLRSARVVHGDIRPQNLLVLPDWRVVLQHLLLRANDEWAGDKRYFAPDVARCMYQRTSITADQMWSNEIWALGASLYELCTGQKLIVVNEKASSTFILKKLNAFTPLAADTVVYAANAKLNRLILDMLNVVPAQRPRAADILQRLEKLRAETPALYAAPLPTSSSSSTTTRASKVVARQCAAGVGIFERCCDGGDVDADGAIEEAQAGFGCRRCVGRAIERRADHGDAVLEEGVSSRHVCSRLPRC
jgi:serine/threonine protein kinase